MPRAQKSHFQEKPAIFGILNSGSKKLDPTYWAQNNYLTPTLLHLHEEWKFVLHCHGEGKNRLLVISVCVLSLTLREFAREGQNIQRKKHIDIFLNYGTYNYMPKGGRGWIRVSFDFISGESLLFTNWSSHIQAGNIKGTRARAQGRRGGEPDNFLHAILCKSMLWVLRTIEACCTKHFKNSRMFAAFVSTWKIEKGEMLKYWAPCRKISDTSHDFECHKIINSDCFSETWCSQKNYVLVFLQVWHQRFALKHLMWVCCSIHFWSARWGMVSRSEASLDRWTCLKEVWVRHWLDRRNSGCTSQKKCASVQTTRDFSNDPVGTSWTGPAPPQKSKPHSLIFYYFIFSGNLGLKKLLASWRGETNQSPEGGGGAVRGKSHWA